MRVAVGVLACCRGFAMFGGNGAWTMMSRLGTLLSNSLRRHYQNIHLSLCASWLQHRAPYNLTSISGASISCLVFIDTVLPPSEVALSSTRHASHVEPSVAGSSSPRCTLECARSGFKGIGPVSPCAMHRLNCITISSPLPITAGRIARSPQLLDVIE
jgi:hypothetical protein